ncbi:NAD(P)-dependent oxidoreductase [Thiopseudomonas alkaliphila]|uniref:NAD(P)-dependent oxidoreductase n=1 Tax=Thiopseudomonas alkaliphila TaxID=1697053 RepID=UPI00069F8960|nr:NAD(P)-dependent oxidoreductase [Thiopseudomonas alkaliphila]AKX51703.1 2-hydroxy-3-oxopropionate reductase [Thiopseudomonas alkaliphila]AKX58039.1 2-hydroxy-3-oxopropionate reductase [Thiopseudomonas alkaliphila]
MAEPKLSIGFAGIGLMGLPMTQRLLQAGYAVQVWNRSPEKLAPLLALGATAANHSHELLHNEVVCLCLADTEAVKQVVYGEQGLLSASQRDKIIIDFSSVKPDFTQQVSQELFTKAGHRWLDIPVSGGVQGALDGSLVMMAGGDQAALEQVRPLLAHLSSRVSYMGPSGAGQTTKICNQMLVASNALVIAEVVALASKAGVDSMQLASALAGGFADSKPLQILAPQMASRSFEPIKWHVRTLLKDLDMATELAKSLQTAVPMSGSAAELMRLHASNGYADQDPATLIEQYLKEATCN